MLCTRASSVERSQGLSLHRLCAVLLLTSLLLTLLPRPGQAQELVAATVRLRIGVTADGIAAVSPADLSAAGIDPLSVDPRSFAMSSLGKPVAIQVSGEGDGRFDSGDRVYFFGERFRGAEMDQKYTAERVYWLDAGGAPGLRVAGVLAAPKGDLTPPQHFATTLRAEDSREWWTLHTLNTDTYDTWFWARLQPPLGEGKNISVNLPYVIPDPAPGQPGAFRLEENSRAGSPSVNPDHRTTVSLNGAALLDQTWDGIRK
jgi:hypothetical protein